jgi:hypothetical protein
LMRPRSEEVPEPDEPDVPEEPESIATAPASVVPAVEAKADREYEYRVDTLTVAEVLDGKTLPTRLEEASHEEWYLVEVIDCGDKKALLLRKRKENKRDRKPLGFFPPAV